MLRFSFGIPSARPPAFLWVVAIVLFGNLVDILRNQSRYRSRCESLNFEARQSAVKMIINKSGVEAVDLDFNPRFLGFDWKLLLGMTRIQ